MTTQQPAITVSPAEAGDVAELGDILGRGFANTLHEFLPTASAADSRYMNMRRSQIRSAYFAATDAKQRTLRGRFRTFLLKATLEDRIVGVVWAAREPRADDLAYRRLLGEAEKMVPAFDFPSDPEAFNRTNYNMLDVDGHCRETELMGDREYISIHMIASDPSANVRGVGQALIRAFQGEGVDIYALGVDSAKGFYEKQGFKSEEPLQYPGWKTVLYPLVFTPPGSVAPVAIVSAEPRHLEAMGTMHAKAFANEFPSVFPTGPELEESYMTFRRSQVRSFHHRASDPEQVALRGGYQTHFLVALKRAADGETITPEDEVLGMVYADKEPKLSNAAVRMALEEAAKLEAKFVYPERGLKKFNAHIWDEFKAVAHQVQDQMMGHADCITVTVICVNESARSGSYRVGARMLDALKEYHLPIFLIAVESALGFYRRQGFTVGEPLNRPSWGFTLYPCVCPPRE